VIVKNEYKNNIFDRKELILAKDTMTNMLIDFSKDTKKIENNTQLEDILLKANNFDSSLFSKRYEEELKHPLKNIVGGEMIRMILLQVQRLKVDVLSSMER
jgi:nuclear control of ATPase protein 2